jgi:hypothetical protein
LLPLSRRVPDLLPASEVAKHLGSYSPKYSEALFYELRRDGVLGSCPPPTTDQRGVGRPQGESCDSGAFELLQQPPKPTTKEECKKGGYKEFGLKNQGRCIAFVNRSTRDQ